MRRIHGAVASVGMLACLVGLPRLMVAQGASAAAAPANHDPRWQPWLGCWRPVGSVAPAASESSELAGVTTPTMICVVPGSTPTAVSVVNFSGGTITDRTTIDPGQPIPKTVGECRGTESATWSRDGNRVLMRGTFACGRGVTRTESAVLSMSDEGEWVQAQSVLVNGQASTYVARFRESGIALEGVDHGAIVERPMLDAAGKRLAPPRTGCTGSEAVTASDDGQRVVVTSDYVCANSLHRVASATFRRTADGGWERTDGAAPPFSSASVRAAAGAPVSTDDVLEVAGHVDVTVAEAWLADRGQAFALNAKELVRLADRGMPPRLIDMLVAVSHPETFAVRPSESARASADIVAREAPRASTGRTGCGLTDDYCRPVVGLSWLYGADRYYGWGRYGYGSPYGFSPYAGYYGAYGYNPYGYGLYGYNVPYGGGYVGPGYYAGSGPVVITTRQAPGEEGRAVYGQGYTRRSSSGGSSSSSGSWPGAQPSSGASSGSSGSSSTGSSGSSSGSAGGASTGRTAKPRGGA